MESGQKRPIGLSVEKYSVIAGVTMISKEAEKLNNDSAAREASEADYV